MTFRHSDGKKNGHRLLEDRQEPEDFSITAFRLWRAVLSDFG